MLFCIVWSVGAALEENSRKKFNIFLLQLVKADPEIPQKFQLELYLQFPFEPHAIPLKIATL
jgi:hypothetical protein